MQVFRDDTYGFILTYPKDWTSVRTTNQRTRLKIVSDRGAGAEDCGVNVQTEPRIKNMTPEQVVSGLADDATFIRAIRTALPDAKIVSGGKTSIGRQAAKFYQLSYTVRSRGIDVPMKMLQVQTARREHLYTVSCRARAKEFERRLPEFEKVMAGFSLER